MIRFPPTSIALSESDVEFHLREIQIKQHLYAQAFTKKEVQRYYNDRYGRFNDFETADDDDDDDDDVLSSRTPSITLTKAREDPVQGGKEIPLTGDMRKPSDTTSFRTVSSSENVQSVQSPTSIILEALSSSPVSIPSSPPMIQMSVQYRHAAVRQSSLLRIVHNAGSQPSTASSSTSNDTDSQDESVERDGSEQGPDDFLPSLATKSRSYRPRSKTYPFIESEADPPTPPTKPNCEQVSSPSSIQYLDQSDGMTFSPATERLPQEHHARMSAYSSPSWPEPDISSPLTLPPPFSVSRRTSSLQFNLPDRTRSSTPSTINQHHNDLRLPPQMLPSELSINFNSLDTSVIHHHHSTPSLPPTSPDTALISSPEDTATTVFPSGHFPSTPPRMNPYPCPYPYPHHSPSSSPPCPPQTEPPNPTSFSVYNDHLPPTSQPQTPLDLQTPHRRRTNNTQTERNVAYTAPPGMSRTAGSSLARGFDGGDGTGMGSPRAGMARLRVMERRAREFGRWRGVRLEAGRARSGGRRERGGEEDAEEGGGIMEAGGDIGLGTGMDGATNPEFARLGLRFEGPDDGLAGPEPEHTQQRLIREWAQFSSLRRRSRPGGEGRLDWRDEFDEDRVGEENF